ncbi:MAG: protein kinase [Herpetosiphonaceae bacterium]|nr:protein kinase [Herpetosiphonaceae bacterium]
MSTIGGYQIIRPLGQGGMGKTFLVQDPQISRQVVVKIISLPPSTDKDALQGIWNRFFREGQAGGQLMHPNIVVVHRLDTDDVFGPYIVMEYVAGTTLGVYEPPNLLSLLDIASQITQALYFMHARPTPIVHRDLKPDNVFLTEQERLSTSTGSPTTHMVAKVGDFGLAQFRTLQTAGETESGHFMGTWPYASPEQMASAADVDQRTDLYALGMMLYEKIALSYPSAYQPFLGHRLTASDREAVRVVKSVLPPPPSLIRQQVVSDPNVQWNIPPQLDDLVLKLLQPNPDDRYQSAPDVFKDLSRIQTGLQQSPARSPSTLPPVASKPVDSAPPSTFIGTPTTPPRGYLEPTDLMRARGIDQVRRIFYELGYNVVDTPLNIATSDWHTASRSNVRRAFWIAEHFTDITPFGIVLFEVDDLSASALQSLARDLLRGGGTFLFIAVAPTSSPTGEEIYDHLVLICPQRDTTPDKVRLLRLDIDTARPTRHALDVLGDIALPSPTPAPDEIYNRIVSAFNIEVITKRFYRDYAKMFNDLVEQVRITNLAVAAFDDPQEVKGFVQRLLGRLMFLYFLQEKGWLGGDQEFLTTQFRLVDGKAANYYRDLLVPLFFQALARPEQERNHDPDAGPVWSQEDIPFLNGGLFELGVGQEYEPTLFINNVLFAPDDRGPFAFSTGEQGGVLAFFNRFAFTVEEDTPEEIAVSLDPEMLGKVFEELITGRHETGSYYTPRPVVAFMGREALKGHLRTRLPNTVSDEAITQFVEERDPSGLKRSAEDALEAIRNIAVCDPACGSGAYLLGMMQELFALRMALLRADEQDAETAYQRKLDIIQRNLYGVDNDPFAVNIARLRLWLSLIVDYQGKNPPPLPNLDYKIMVGDSLVETINGESLIAGVAATKEIVQREAVAGERAELQAEFEREREKLFDFDGTTEERRKLKERLLDLEQALMRVVLAGQRDKLEQREQEILSKTDWSIPSRATKYRRELKAIEAKRNVIEEIDRQVKREHRRPIFPWHLYFTEVFGGRERNPGFDIVLANPPYVRADAQYRHLSDNETNRLEAVGRWQTYRAMLVESGLYETLYEKWDLYIPFLERAHQLLRQGGQMIFIIPDAYNAAKYTRKSHDFFLSESRIARLDFCSEIPLFEGVSVWNTILHFAKTTPSSPDVPLRIRRWGKSSREFTANSETLPTGPQKDLGQATFRYDREQAQKMAVDTIPLRKICYMSKGMVIHADERRYLGAFKTEDVISAVKDSLHPKPFIQGRDIAKWVAERIQYLEWGTERAPGMFRRQTFPELYSVPEKFITMDIGSEELKVVYDDEQLLHNHSASSVVLWHYLSGVRNKSIRKSAKYHDEFKPSQKPDFFREDLEAISKAFIPKYIIAIMNSSFARVFVNQRRKSTLNIYPDDWKPLPIAVIPKDEQQGFVALVDAILEEYAVSGYPLPTDVAVRVVALEQELNRKVYDVYGVTPDQVSTLGVDQAATTDIDDETEDEE